MARGKPRAMTWLLILTATQHFSACHNWVRRTKGQGENPALHYGPSDPQRPSGPGLGTGAQFDAAIYWSYQEIRQVTGFSDDNPVRFEKVGDIPEILIVEDPVFLIPLHEFTPQKAQRFQNPARRKYYRVPGLPEKSRSPKILAGILPMKSTVSPGATPQSGSLRILRPT